MELFWNDGGRAGSGFVGLTGDCVVRSIAIATGTSYRDVYREIGKASQTSPRRGVPTRVAALYLERLGWQHTADRDGEFTAAAIPPGVVIVDLAIPDSRRHGHFSTVIDHVVHDTWNPCQELEFRVVGYWTNPSVRSPGGASPTATGAGQHPVGLDDEQVLTQQEFDKILHRLRSLDNTAKNRASTEGEKRNALRMMQSLMLRHNLSRADIVDQDNVDAVSFTKMVCPVNGRRACGWEKSLAAYLTQEVFPMAWWFFTSHGPRSLFSFYGPVKDVQNCIALFRELLLTIATSAQLQYGGYSRGSGASYAEGYVRGLPRQGAESPPETEQSVARDALIHARTLAMKRAATDWLRIECGITLSTSRGSGRDQQDPEAAERGQKHGARHDLSAARGPLRITLKP